MEVLGEMEVHQETVTDRTLLERHIAGDETAFPLLVNRHNLLVKGVCHRILRNSNDIDDAFQATFLVLARRANVLVGQDSIAGWLHQTARRTSMKLRCVTRRRREKELEVAKRRIAMEAQENNSPSASSSVGDVGMVLDEEMMRLPERFREAILLCQVEGLSRQEAAERIGISLSAIKDRLERGRELLRSRLTRRGISMSAGAIAAWLVPGCLRESCSSALVISTSKMACSFAAGNVGLSSAPMSVTIAQGVLKAMGLQKLKTISIFVVSLISAGTIAFGFLQDNPSRFEKGLRGQVVQIAKEGKKTLTLELDEYQTLLSLDVADKPVVQIAYEQARFEDLQGGEFVSVELAADHRTVEKIHVQGTIREAVIKSVGDDGTLVIETSDDSSDAVEKVKLADDAILRIGGTAAARRDLVAGMEVPLEFGIGQEQVNAIELEGSEFSFVEGALQKISLDKRAVTLVWEGESDRIEESTFAIESDAIITLDGNMTKLEELQLGFSVKARLAESGKEIRALQVFSSK